MLLTFYLFRVSLVPRHDGTLFARATHGDKSALIAAAIRARSEGVYRNTVYQILNPLVDEQEDVIHFRLCRPESKDIARRDPDTGDLIDDEMPSFAWTHGIYTGTGSQIVAIARRVEFFAGKPKNYAVILKNILDNALRDSDFEPHVIPLDVTSRFWKAVGSLDIVTSIKFDLIPPNVFGGHENLSETLKYLASMVRIKRLRQAFVGDHDVGLNPSEEVFEEYSSYSAEGGGSWDVYGKKNGKTMEYHSNSEVRAIKVETGGLDFSDLGDGKEDVLRQAVGATGGGSVEEQGGKT